MDWQQRNTETYNSSAEKLAAYFKGIGARTEDIELALELAQPVNEARVIEIGCGDGRDAQEIVKRVGWYEGIDPSSGLLNLAREKLPKVSFVEADAISYDYPENLDVIYAFASLLHVKKEDMSAVFKKGYNALKPGGIYYVSLKERPKYTEEVQIDQYGERMFYYYTVELVRELAGPIFEAVHESHHTVGKTNWFTLALKKLILSVHIDLITLRVIK